MGWGWRQAFTPLVLNLHPVLEIRILYMLKHSSTELIHLLAHSMWIASSPPPPPPNFGLNTAL